MAWICGSKGCPKHSQPSHRCQGWKLAGITGSVGRGGQNRSADVAIVQGALNRHVGKPGGAATPLATDGIAGPKTIAAITAFQSTVAGLSRPDGRVDPNRRTIRHLSGAPSIAPAPPPAGSRNASALVFRHRNFEVLVGTDGAIKVRHGDSLSKYSSAIRNDPMVVFGEFGRLNRHGTMEAIADVRRISAGETIYYVPMYDAWNFGRRLTLPIATPPKTSLNEKLGNVGNVSYNRDEVLRGALERDYGLPGERAELALRAIKILGYSKRGLSLAGLVADVAGLASKVGGIILAFSGWVTFVHVLVGPVANVIKVLNAKEEGYRQLGLRAHAFATTAWAFDHPPPATSVVVGHFRDSPRGPAALREAEQVWDSTVRSVFASLRSDVAAGVCTSVPTRRSCGPWATTSRQRFVEHY